MTHHDKRSMCFLDHVKAAISKLFEVSHHILDLLDKITPKTNECVSKKL